MKTHKGAQLLCRKLLFIVLLALSFGASEKSCAFPVPEYFDSAFETLANAEYVCKVKVLEVPKVGDVTTAPFGLAELSHFLASTEVISVIKGQCPKRIEIEFSYPQPHEIKREPWLRRIYSRLDANETALVFLKGSGSPYRLNSSNGSLRVEPGKVEYQFGSEPNLRLLAEFLASAKSSNQLVELQAVEQLGYVSKEILKRVYSDRSKLVKGARDRIKLALSRTRRLLLEKTNSENLVVRDVALISCFQAGVSPGIDRPLELLKTSTSRFDANDSISKYGRDSYARSKLQSRLLMTMDQTTRRFLINLEDFSVIRSKNGRPKPFRGVPGFDYAAFYGHALDCNVVTEDSEMRSHIANVIWIRYEKASVPDMIRLLDDPAISIRRTAASALRKCINSDMSNSWEPDIFYKRKIDEGPEKSLEERMKDYERNEQEYISYWKKWGNENKHKYIIND